MTVGQIFIKIGNFIENRQIFILLNCNCAKLANFKDFKTCLGSRFFRGHSVYCLPNELTVLALITFRVSRRPREMYCVHARLCVCLSLAACPHYCTDPDVTWRSGRGCPLVVHYWANLQSVHGLRCYGNTMEMRGRAQR